MLEYTTQGALAQFDTLVHYHGSFWHAVAQCGTLSWQFLAHCGTMWCTMEPFGTLWHNLAHYDTIWHIVCTLYSKVKCVR